MEFKVYQASFVLNEFHYQATNVIDPIPPEPEIWKTVIGNPIQITDAIAAPVKKLIVDFQNADGLTGCNINVRGINFYDGVWEYGTIIDSTGMNGSNSTSYFRSKNYLPIPANTNFYWFSPTRTGNFRQFFYDKDKNYLGHYGRAWNTVIPITTLSPVIASKMRYIRFRVSGSYSDANDSKISINYPTTVTEYIPYDGTTTPISWQTEAGSITSGTLTIAEDGSVTLETGGITHQLANITPITLFDGENNVWCDDGVIELTYLANE